jgi:hypothetical protein
MTIVDTNVASEMMKARPAVQVLEWLNAKSTSSLFIHRPDEGRNFFGYRVAAAGRKREALHRAAGEMFRTRLPAPGEPR